MKINFSELKEENGKSADEQGLYKKFEVKRVDGSDAPGGKHDGCRYFVLDLDHDPHAKAAMSAYAQSCVETEPKLSEDLQVEFPLPQTIVWIRRRQEDGAIMDMLLDSQIEEVRKKSGAWEPLQAAVAVKA